jgi:hypothetical protein
VAGAVARQELKAKAKEANKKKRVTEEQTVRDAQLSSVAGTDKHRPKEKETNGRVTQW